MNKTEHRWREGSGEKYLQDGRVRCQSQSKTKLRRWREEYDDYVTPNDDIWPECQCPLAAVDGFFVCHYHGGRTPTSRKPRSILDVAPIDLVDKLETLLENPMYIDRKEDIMLIQARTWQLVESLRDDVGSEEAWGMVTEAIVALNGGDDVSALALLKDAQQYHAKEKEVWREIRQNDNVLKDLTNTQVKTAKELQQMITAEQMGVLILSLQSLLQDSVEKYIKDEDEQVRFLRHVSAEIAKLANIGPIAVGNLLSRGGNAADRDA